MHPKTHRPARAGLAIAAAVACGIAAPPTQAATLAELQAQIDALQKQVTELVQQKASAAAPAPSQAVTGGATPGSFKLPGSNTSVTIGGYAKLDAIHSSRSAGVNSLGDQFLFPSLIPVGPGAGAAEKGQTTLHARQSRFYFRTATPSRWGDITTLVEGDFFGADGNESVSNGHGLRLRHAWGSIGRLSAGQFWTNFLNEGAYAETLDFGGPVGQIFVRQAQLRWTQPFTGGDWSVSTESPESVLSVPGSSTTFRADDDRSPDLTGRVRFTAGGGRYSVQVLARQIRGDSPAAPLATDSRWGGVIGFAGVVPTFGKDDLRFNLNAGNALGRYQELGFLPDGHLDAAGRLALADAVSGYVAYRRWWTPELRSSLVLSATRADNPSGVFGGINKAAESVHLNLIWSPLPTVNLGAELIHAERELEDGRSGRLNRVQLSAQYGF